MKQDSCKAHFCVVCANINSNPNAAKYIELHFSK